MRAVPAAILLLTRAWAQPADVPAGFDRIENGLLAFMQRHNLPGASVAVAKEGRLVFARGYGLADSDQAQPVQPASVFRFGSIGKTITSIALMKLVESGSLSLDDRAFTILSDITARSGRPRDARVADITVRHLLTHSGGWDASVSGEPIVAPAITQIAAAMGVPFPPPPEAIISYMLDRRLDFDPGTRFAYSNFGFLVLGRVIEKVSGQRYEDFVRREIFAPLGIERMRLSRTPLALRAPGEARYYDYAGAPLIDSLMPGFGGQVPEPYSGILPFESIDSAGAWAASAIDLVRIFAMLDGKPPAILSPDSIRQMVTPAVAIATVGTDAANGKSVYYGLGIAVDSAGPDAEWWHDGGTWGTRAFVARLRDGWSWSVIFNSAPWETMYTISGGPNFDAELQSVFSVTALESVDWPRIDLFPHYLAPARPAADH
jgi:N-acyl-D-amino-acid deacylase